MSIVVYGASDDLIEVEGDVDEEFPYQNEEKGDLLGFSDGTILRVRYDRDGVWRIHTVLRGPNSKLEIVQASVGDEDNYSDKATITTGVAVRWVLHGDIYAVASGREA